MSITDTVPLPVLATYSRLPSALIANALGEEPTEIGWVPATLGLVSISSPVAANTDTVLLPVSATYTRVPSGSGLTTTPAGLLPVCAVKVTGAALVINAALVTSGTVWLVDIAASPDIEASPTTVCWLFLVATVSMAWLVSVGLTGRLRLSSAPACPNWRGRAPTASNANSSGESTGVSGPLGASGPKPAVANAANTTALTVLGGSVPRSAEIA